MQADSRTINSTVQLVQYNSIHFILQYTGGMYVCMVITYSKGKDQSGKVANPARGQLDKDFFFPHLRSRLRIWSYETGSAVPSRISLLISILRLNLVLTYEIPPGFRGGVHCTVFLKKNQNAPRPSEHPPVRGKKCRNV